MQIRTSSLNAISVVIMASLSLLSSCSGGDDSWVKESVDLDSIRVVENGPYPREWTGSLEVLCLEDEVIIGQGREEDAFLLSARPSRGLVTGGLHGQVGYVEHQPPEIRVFGTDGECLWQAGRSGDGPGEFRYPNRPGYAQGIGWIVNAPTLNQLVVFGEDGSFSRTVSLLQVPRAQHFSRLEFAPTGDFWILAHKSRSKDDGLYMSHYVVWVEWGSFRAAEADSFEHLSMTSKGQDFYMYDDNPVNLAVDDLGRAWVNGVFEYQIDVYDQEVMGHWRIRREYKLAEYPAAYREQQESEIIMEMDDGKYFNKLPPLEQAIRGMEWTEQGEMWVFQSAYVDSPLVQVDVFDRNGVFVRAFLADRSLNGMPIGRDHLWRGDIAEDGSPLLIYSRYWFEDEER